jgi:acetyl-CoA carboxylase biotin carboxyl carrier protein
MNFDEIRELIRIVEETGIAELEVQRGENRVRIRRPTGTAQDIVMPTVLPVPIAAPAAHAPPPAAPIAVPDSASISAAAAPKEEEQDMVVKSPIVGTYYDAPAPGDAPFVKIGDRVEPKQVLCIIESMKLMNEIEAEMSGTLVAKFVENGRPVEYGESLFAIRPL